MKPVSKTLYILAAASVGLMLLPTAAQAGLARIMSISGSVQLRRSTWSEFQRALPGTALYGPDLLQPIRGSRILVICSEGNRWIVPAGTISAVNNGCPGTPSALKPQFGIGDLRGGSDRSIPYVITPRVDVVLNNAPTLRWNPVEGAKTYTVSLQTRQGVRWELETDQTTLPYPSDQPKLQPGVRYRLVVAADTGSRSTDEEPDLRFNLLAGEQAETAKAEIAEVQAMDLPDMLQTMILVEEVYPRYELTAAAINDLEALIASGYEMAKGHRLLADFYLKSGLRQLAEEAYQRAIALATASENLEEQVLAQYGLGTLYSRVGDFENAAEQLHAARIGAQALGDETLANDIHAICNSQAESIDSSC